MNIVQINTYYGYGSTGKIVKEIEKKQTELGINSYVLYGKWDTCGEIKDNVYKINSQIGYYIHKIKTHLLGKHAFYSKRDTKRAIKLLDELKPDIIHLHNLHGHYINIEILMKYIIEKDIPVVWTFHDCWPFTGHCPYFTSIDCNKWKNECYQCALKRGYPRSFIFDRSRESFRDKKKLFLIIPRLQIVTVSDWLGNLVKQSMFKESHIKTIYNWIDTKVFYYRDPTEICRKYQLEDKFIILGVATGWYERKGLEDFLRISEKLQSDEIIILIGKMTRTQLPHNILSFGATNSKEELAQFYSLADVFVNPSKQETFGLTTAEAMACGTPVITYNVTACPEVVGLDESCGYTVEIGNPDQIVTKIQEIKRRGKLEYTQACIDRVGCLFDKEEKLNEYMDVYKQLMGSTNK